ncbi:conserved hypothetical protein [Luminiphilus syltensis NOR5-1B]|uniref:Uncharacterized protein n=2 Tax=Luminiphilus TaxID=1341118 RepID=B8KXP9_9GAMM|nr:conserved hypothetical protein [Luminiphilus syltensis NOR5-1B]
MGLMAAASILLLTAVTAYLSYQLETTSGEADAALQFAQIVDKGSKLEALYNRIHEIRMRFEVLLRDAEIDFWQSVVVK